MFAIPPGDAARSGTGIVLRDPLPWHQLVQVVQTAEETGHHAVFVPESSGREAFATLAGFALATSTIRLGTGVVTVRARSPATTAMAATTVQELSGGRSILGLGAGTPRRPLDRGSSPDDPVDRVREYVQLLRQALAGDRVGPSDRWDVEGFTLVMARAAEPPPIWLGALGDRMVTLAATVADGVLLNWCTPERVADARRTVDQAAEAAGRDPSVIRVAVYVRACLGVEERVAVEALRAATVQYASIPHYRRQMERMGLGEPAAHALASARAGRTDLVPEELVRALAVTGGQEQWTHRARAFHRAGADLVLCYPVPALDPFSSIMGTVMTAAPSPAVER